MQLLKFGVLCAIVAVGLLAAVPDAEAQVIVETRCSSGTAYSTCTTVTTTFAGGLICVQITQVSYYINSSGNIQQTTIISPTVCH